MSFAIGLLLMTFMIAIVFMYGLQSQQILSIHWGLDFKQMMSLSFLLGIVALFVAALQEEIVFRGFLTANLGKYGIIWALLGSSVIFTSFHFLTSKVNTFQVIDWFMGGLIFFVIYIVSGSLLVSTIVHFGRNLVNTLIFDIADMHVFLRLDVPVKPQHKTIYMFILTLGWLAALSSYLHMNQIVAS
jgi:hypothetical protein